MINVKSLYEALTDEFDIGWYSFHEFERATEQEICGVIERWAATQETPHQKAARLHRELNEVPAKEGNVITWLIEDFYGFKAGSHWDTVYETIDISLLNNNLDNDFPDEVKHD